jgi:hypothetical protein
MRALLEASYFTVLRQDGDAGGVKDPSRSRMGRLRAGRRGDEHLDLFLPISEAIALLSRGLAGTVAGFTAVRLSPVCCHHAVLVVALCCRTA